MRKFLIGGSVAALIILIIVLFTTIFAPRTEAPEVGEVSSSSISESLSSSEISSSVEEQSESIDEPTSESNEESSIEETSAEKSEESFDEVDYIPVSGVVNEEYMAPFGYTEVGKYAAEQFEQGITEIPLWKAREDLNMPDLTGDQLYSETAYVVELNPQWGLPASYSYLAEDVLYFGADANKDLIESNKKELDLLVREWLSGYDFASMSDYEKSYTLQKIIVENIVYDYDAYYIIMNDDPNHIYTIEENNRMRSASEPIPVMTNKLGVCDGYAHVYHILSRAVGLEALYVPGPLISDAEVSETHAWNMVNIEGTWVGIDTTWADMGDTAAFRYFHMPLGLFYRDRVTYMDFSSMAQLDYEDMTTDWTWYGQNGYVATADNIFDLVDRMREEQKMAEILLVGLDEGTRLELMEYLDEVMDSDVEYYSLEQDYLYYAHHGDQP